MSSPRSVRNASSSVRSEHVRNTRARAWAFVFDCYHRKQEAAPESRPDDAERSLNDGARNIMQDTK
jgi:hypothetical protein